MPQIHRGDRDVVTFRVAPELNQKLARYVQAIGMTKSDFIAELLDEKLRDVDLENLDEEQARLPLSA